MEHFEYIRCFWKYIDDETPVVLFYEVDLQNERYATRAVEVFPDCSVEPITELGFGFVTEAPIPSVEEINRNPAFFSESIIEESSPGDVFFAERITKAEFEAAFECQEYAGAIDFLHKIKNP